MSGITTAISSGVSAAGAVGLSLLNKAPTVYSFMDLSGSISHPITESYIFTGQGIGTITITMDHDKSFHEIDVYGNVMVGRIKGSNGRIQIACQQSSNIHSWLGATFNAVEQAVDKEWARMNLLLRNVITGDSFSATGVTFTTIAEESYSAQGALVTWILLFAECSKFIANPSGKGQMSALQKAVKSIV